MNKVYTGAEILVARQKQLKELRKDLDELKEYLVDTSKTVKEFSISDNPLGCEIGLVEHFLYKNNMFKDVKVLNSIKEMIGFFRTDGGMKSYKLIKEKDGLYTLDSPNAFIFDKESFKEAHDSILNKEILKYKGAGSLSGKHYSTMESSYRTLLLKDDQALCRQWYDRSIKVCASREEHVIDNVKLTNLLERKFPYRLDLDKYLEDKKIVHDYEFVQDFYEFEELGIEETPNEYVLYLK